MEANLVVMCPLTTKIRGKIPMNCRKIAFHTQAARILLVFRL